MMRFGRFILALLVLTSLCFAEDVLDLNSATRAQVDALPITPEQADAIWERMVYEGPFKSIYELNDLPQIDPITMMSLRSLVRVNPPRPGDDRLDRIEDAYYRIENLGTEEGTNVGLVDEWIDRMLEPMNVNEATLDELMDLQNVSPADAVAIYNQVKLQGGIRGSRDLRAVPGLSSWGYRNARNYLTYDPTVRRKKLHGAYTFRAYDTPFFADEELAIDPTRLVDPTPDVSHKLRLNYSKYKGGALWHRSLGEQTIYWDVAGAQIPEFKWFAGLEKDTLGPVRLDRVYVGNYQISLGQGVAMESGDYFNPRYSGFGFDKRLTGIAPDLSRSQEFTLKGAAAEASYGKLKGIAFVSSQLKDAILNPDGSLNRLITLVPRDDLDIYPTQQKLTNGDTVTVPAFEGTQSMLNAVREVAVGGELAYRPWVGTSVGIIATEFDYDRPIKPDFGQGYKYDAVTRAGKDTVVTIYPVIDPQERDEIGDNILNSEILNGHRSDVDGGIWSGARGIRRTFGLDLMQVVNNYTFQFEYAELEQNGGVLAVGDDPHGLVASAHAQWNSLTLLGVYRDYSIGYDNPYSHGFANYSRYNGTTYEDEFYLSTPTFAQIERNSASPQAEQGVYFETRYQLSRPILLVGEIDNWTRVPDQADYYRWVAKITYRPVWPIQLRLRQKLQGRWNSDPEQPSGFLTYENRINLEYRLSRYDELQLMYASGYTRFTPRPRLIGDPDPTGEHPLDAQSASPQEAVGIEMTHNFAPSLKLKAAWLVYDGFLWNFEDTEFVVVDGKSTRWWVSLTNRFSNSLTARFKVTGDSPVTKTFVQARDGNSYPDPVSGRSFGGDNVVQRAWSFRIQLDYLF
ncbi:MAG: hypothetical protein KDB65_02685 [Calditrichaeota bacterium]|nr:hypothetical protein [Calditrichota bacterium]MCB9367970.1 hypothetical protein [Calditrichota bacterium]